jgi:hypothetical protein
VRAARLADETIIALAATTEPTAARKIVLTYAKQ